MALVGLVGGGALGYNAVPDSLIAIVVGAVIGAALGALLYKLIIGVAVVVGGIWILAQLNEDGSPAASTSSSSAAPSAASAAPSAALFNAFDVELGGLNEACRALYDDWYSKASGVKYASFAISRTNCGASFAFPTESAADAQAIANCGAGCVVRWAYD